MPFASTPELRAEVLAACRVLTFFRIVEGFGHVSARVGADRVLITPRRALGLVTEAELVELDLDGRQVAGEGRPPLEVPMHLSVYRRRGDTMAIARGHPRNVAAEPYLITAGEMADGVASALGGSEAVILQGNGMLAVGRSVPHACVQALFLEETAELQLCAQAAGLTPQFYSAQGAARRHGDDRVHEPIRAWEYYVAAAEGRLTIAR